MNNPLLSTAPLPAFASIRPAHIQPAITELLAAARQAQADATAESTPADFDALERILSTATERLSVSWGAVSHLNAVANTPELREAYNAMLPAVTEFYTGLGADETLFAKYKAIQRTQGATLNAARQQALRHWIRDFVLSGADLQGEAKTRFAAIQERAAELGQSFSEHVMDATDGWVHYATPEEVLGVPDDVLAQTRQAAEADGQAGLHKITLHFPCYLPVMQYASHRPLRERVYRAYVTRASELAGKPEWDNSALMQELLALHQEEAALLGYANYAEVSLVPKMAESPAQVMAFLRELAAKARPHAQRDLDALRAFAREQLSDEFPEGTLQAWDQAYVSEKLKMARYAFSDQEVKQYLTLPRVLEGLFSILERVFGVRLVADSAEVWHESVRFYRLEREGQVIGHVYLDLYARTGKRPGAWMDEVRGRWRRPEGVLQLPVAHLVCNFASPVGDKPALLTHDDVTTLFHEVGHGLHHLLTRVEEPGVSGISGVEWDAVELPSQFMENFCWEWEVLQQLSRHVDSGEPLPRSLFDKMVAAKNYQAGLQTLRQIEFALFDMRVHAEPGCESRIQQVLDEVRAEISVNPPPAFNRFQHSFSHIFAGGYSAGYYSYKWAEVLSADAWSAFEEEGVFNPAVGRRYLESILEVGGSRDAMDNFKAFRGREPSIDALLRHQGMAA